VNKGAYDYPNVSIAGETNHSTIAEQVMSVPRQRSENSIEAEKRYRNGEKLVDIAKSLNVPEGTVRRWKCDQSWEGRKESCPISEHEGCSVSKPNVRKRGAPPRNQNATKHGLYSEPFSDILEGRDQEVYEGISTDGIDEEDYLIKKIALLTVRERWLHDKIQQLQKCVNESGGLLLNNVNRFERIREFDNLDDEALYNERQRLKIEAGEKLPGREVSTSATSVDGTDLLLRAHAELTRVQEQSRRCAEALNRIRQSKDETKGNKLANDWIMALIGGESNG